MGLRRTYDRETYCVPSIHFTPDGRFFGYGRGDATVVLARNPFADGGCIRDPERICDGDVDGDGQVNLVDAGLVQAAFGCADEQDVCSYDVDCDGQIDPVDAGIVQSLFDTCNAPRDACPWLIAPRSTARTIRSAQYIHRRTPVHLRPTSQVVRARHSPHALHHLHILTPHTLIVPRRSLSHAGRTSCGLGRGS